MRWTLVYGIFLLLALFFLGSCATAGQNPAALPRESREDAESALGTVVGAVSGREVSRKELETLGRQIQTNGETRSAVEAITNSMSGTAGIKYCPVDGQRYSPKFMTCPVHHIELKEL